MKVDAETVKELFESGEYVFSHCKVDEENCSDDTIVIDAYFKEKNPLKYINIEFKSTINE